MPTATLSAELVRPANGLTLNADRSFNCTPNAGFMVDSFSYSASTAAAQQHRHGDQRLLVNAIRTSATIRTPP
jgi:hypothetical protein